MYMYVLALAQGHYDFYVKNLLQYELVTSRWELGNPACLVLTSLPFLSTCSCRTFAAKYLLSTFTCLILCYTWRANGNIAKFKAVITTTRTRTAHVVLDLFPCSFFCGQILSHRWHLRSHSKPPERSYFVVLLHNDNERKRAELFTMNSDISVHESELFLPETSASCGGKKATLPTWRFHTAPYILTSHGFYRFYRWKALRTASCESQWLWRGSRDLYPRQPCPPRGPWEKCIKSAQTNLLFVPFAFSSCSLIFKFLLHLIADAHSSIKNLKPYGPIACLPVSTLSPTFPLLPATFWKTHLRSRLGLSCLRKPSSYSLLFSLRCCTPLQQLPFSELFSLKVVFSLVL